MDNKTAKKQLVISIICILVLSLGGFFIYNYLHPEKSDDKNVDRNNNDNTIDKKSNVVIEIDQDDSQKKITVNYEILKNGDYLFIIKNETNNLLTIDCIADTYSGNDVSFTQRIGAGTDARPNGYSYAVLHKSAIEKAGNNKIVVKMTPIRSIHGQFGNMISHTEKQNDDHILVTVTNNSGVNLTYIIVEILYYDENNKVVAYDAGMTDREVAIGSIQNIKILHPVDDNYKDISFSRYEIKTSTL